MGVARLSRKRTFEIECVGILPMTRLNKDTSMNSPNLLSGLDPSGGIESVDSDMKPVTVTVLSHLESFV